MIKILEKGKDTLRIELDDLTLVNLLNENLWKKKIKLSAYTIDHPYLSKPVLLVKSDDPKKSLLTASAKIQKDVDEIKKELGKIK